MKRERRLGRKQSLLELNVKRIGQGWMGGGQGRVALGF